MIHITIFLLIYDGQVDVDREFSKITVMMRSDHEQKIEKKQ